MILEQRILTCSGAGWSGEHSWSALFSDWPGSERRVSQSSLQRVQTLNWGRRLVTWTWSRIVNIRDNKVSMKKVLCLTYCVSLSHKCLFYNKGVSHIRVWETPRQETCKTLKTTKWDTKDILCTNSDTTVPGTGHIIVTARLVEERFSSLRVLQHQALVTIQRCSAGVSIQGSSARRQSTVNIKTETKQKLIKIFN